MKNWIYLLLVVAACHPPATKNEPAYDAGFTTIHLTDSARTYKPGSSADDYLHYRPIDIDLWYPAGATAKDTAVTVHDLLGLLEQRANYYSASGAGKGVAGQLAKLFCDLYACADSAALLRYRTGSIKNAPAAKGKFPLVIYLTAFNGMSYENFTLFESLAKRGFVVVSISSIGRFPGDMTTKYADLVQQVDDAVAAVRALKNNPNIEFGKVGIVGYSWGGLAGALLAGRIPGVQCLVSLEGSEFHHYGKAKSENADFDEIRASNDFKHLNLSCPYLRLESAPATHPEKTDSVYDFALAHTSKPEIFTIDSARHIDFDCMSLVVKQAGHCRPDQRYASALQLTVGFLSDHLKGKNRLSHFVLW